MTKPMLYGASAKPILEAMNYTDGVNTCSVCKYFVPTDISGNPSAMNCHCDLNRSVKLPVSPTGTCKYFEKK